MSFDIPIELLKGCVRCKQCPKFSSFGSLGQGTTSWAMVCCTSINGKSLYETMSKWNRFNMECENTYKLDRQTNKWEILKDVPNET